MSLHARSLLLLFTLVFATALHAEKPALITRTFKIPPDFLSCDTPDRGSPAAPADPFAAPATTPTAGAPPPSQPTPAKQILEATGITFPDGASASFNPITGTLTVTNTKENLDLTEAYVAMFQKQAPANVAFILTVIEAPGALIREADAAASKTANATAALAALLDHTKREGSGVRVVGDAFLETKSGTRATLEAVREHSHVTEFNLDAKSRASIAQEMRQLGLRLEIEPTVGADSATIEITFALHLNPAPPVQRQVSVNDPLTGHAAEFPTTDVPGAQITSGISVSNGHTKLLSISKPVGTSDENSDTLWAAFLTTTLRRVEALPAPQPKVAAPAAVPSGMIFAALPAPDGLFDQVLNWPSVITLQSWLAQAGITFPPGAYLKQHDGLLHLINTPDNIALIAAVVDHELNNAPKTVAVTVHTLEAPAAFLRDLTRQTLATADDAAMFAAVEAAVARGEARFIDSAFLETKSGTRATGHAAREHFYLDNFGTDAKGHPDLTFETRAVGSLLEVEPTIGADSHTVELTFAHELHPTAPMVRYDHFRDPASPQLFEMPVTDFHTQKTVTDISVRKGGIKLISLNKPSGREAPGMLWATFLKCNVVPQVVLSRHTTSHAPAEEPKPPVDPKAWNARTYKVPPDFLSIGGDGTPKTAKMILESFGIPFPEGAVASFNPVLAKLFVKNTNENLDLVEAFIEPTCVSHPKLIAFTTHVLQAPGPLLRRLTTQAASKSNHRAELDELFAAVKAGTVQHLNIARIETKSGTRATAGQGTEHSALTEVSVNEKGEPFFGQETRQVGLRVELEPIIGADGETIELTIAPEFHTAPPFEHREHVIHTQGRRLEFPLTDYHVAKVTTGISITDGCARLLSLYKPVGKPEFEKEDILQAIFITCDILRVGE